jgi:hypothetical protein
MKASEVLKNLEEMYEEDGDLDEEFQLLDTLDYLGILGIPHASDCYRNLIQKMSEKQR